MNQQHNARRTQSRSSDGNEAGSASEMPMRPGGESMGGARGEVPFSEAAKRATRRRSGHDVRRRQNGDQGSRERQTAQ